MIFEIKFEDNEMKEIVKDTFEYILKNTFKKELEKSTVAVLGDEGFIWSCIIKAIKELSEKEIKNIIKQNNQAIIQMLREEINKLARQEMNINEKITQEEIASLFKEENDNE